MPIRATRLTSLLRTGPSLVRPASSIATRTATAATSASSAGAARPRPSRHSIQLQPLQPARPGDGRAFASGGATIGKAQSDLLVDELQELYEVAKDEFEIATDSTDSATIYAASDRESARDALNQLLSAYSLYTSAELRPTAESHQPQQAQPDDGGMAPAPTTYDPADIKPEVREEVRKRVGQRVRELENAVMVLEEKAQESD